MMRPPRHERACVHDHLVSQERRMHCWSIRCSLAEEGRAAGLFAYARYPQYGGEIFVWTGAWLLRRARSHTSQCTVQKQALAPELLPNLFQPRLPCLRRHVAVLHGGVPGRGLCERGVAAVRGGAAAVCQRRAGPGAPGQGALGRRPRLPGLAQARRAAVALPALALMRAAAAGLLRDVPCG